MTPGHRGVTGRPSGKPPTDWRFARRPGWILSHLFVLACVVTFLFLANWQLNRLHGRRDVNAMIEAREQADPGAARHRSSRPRPRRRGRRPAYRTVTVTGHYDTGEPGADPQPHPQQQRPGLVADDPARVGRRHDRGGREPGLGALRHRRERLARRSSRRRPGDRHGHRAACWRTQNRVSGPYDPADGTLRTLSRVDLNRWQHQLPVPALPGLREPAVVGPGPVRRPARTRCPPPELGDGPHLNYAGQWLIFATLTVIVYPLLLRRRARDKAIENAEAEPTTAERVEPETSVAG